ncbi:Uncharacterised protein [Mycolicibacterium vanbaalenii]|uniref:Uncharacterized protein n=1 Tax=Mycolicibacterium vanbaalenii TaxID=110539 RepID=A0A5S9R430_MYCVN|nr:hypothetical protein [Mycolicibacterium vanbaalenii]CAA0129269.1 Uncharacterised protein [Mycolicibacterium vanbaalenii]
MTAPVFRSLEQLSGVRSGVEAVLSAADSVAGELDRLRVENALLRRQVRQLTAKAADAAALCATYSDEIRVLSAELESYRSGVPRRSS